MRIIAGRFRGTKLQGPGPTGSFRPTEDRTREALFSILGAMTVGPSFLDLYAGSGAVGLEAFSRGFGPVCLVEQDRGHLTVLRRNLTRLTERLGPDDERPTVVAADVARFLASGRAADFDVVFADPPYELVDEAFVATVVGAVTTAAGRLVVLEHSSATVLPDRIGRWERRRSSRYGTATLSFLHPLPQEVV